MVSPLLNWVVNFVSLPLTYKLSEKVIVPSPYFAKSLGLSTGIDLFMIKHYLSKDPYRVMLLAATKNLTSLWQTPAQASSSVPSIN